MAAVPEYLDFLEQEKAVEAKLDGKNPSLRLKYHDSIADTVADLGKPEDISAMFSGFQKHSLQTAE